MSLSGDDLIIRHIGMNHSWPELGYYYYDFTETVSGLENSYIHYSFGER